MRTRCRPSRSTQRSQSLVEFAIVAPLLLLLLFGVVDFGRVVYIYVTLNQAVNEGARVAVRDSPLLPGNTEVEQSVRTHAVDVVLANPCPNGPLTNAAPPPNTGWVYITEPAPPATVEQLAELVSGSIFNAPGGQFSAGAAGSCSATNPGHDHAALQVTIRYNFVPITPLLRQVTANSLIISASTVYRTEY